MRKFTIEDVQGNSRFSALTQGDQGVIDKLIESCNENQAVITGYIETRRDVLMEKFDREALLSFLEFAPSFDKENIVYVKFMKNLIEKIARDSVQDHMVEEFVLATGIKKTHFSGDLEKVADCIQAYYQCGKVCTIAQTWREKAEEIEKGAVIYYEPSARTV